MEVVTWVFQQKLSGSSSPFCFQKENGITLAGLGGLATELIKRLDLFDNCVCTIWYTNFKLVV